MPNISREELDFLLNEEEETEIERERRLRKEKKSFKRIIKVSNED